MPYDVTPLIGRVFTHPETGTEFGQIRTLDSGAVPPSLPPGYSPIAQDGGGNIFLASLKGAIHFWDHETGQLTALAPSWERFCAGSVWPAAVHLDPSQVKSAWINPDFAKKHGLEIRPDGWVKRSENPPQ